MKRAILALGCSLAALFSTQPAFADPVEYVKVCDVFGASYYYVPGTEFCFNSNTGLMKWNTEYGVMQAYSRLAQSAAVALAIPTPQIGPDQHFAIAGNVASVGGVGAMGFAFAARLNLNLTLHAGMGVGFPGMDTAFGLLNQVPMPADLLTMGTVAGFNYAW